ncbi:MAG TPA: NAD-dependent epimerase/dehydratase family protein [Steroidobacteraceae bacterium]|nr:NAD-dependent epimerase/dehydratase family protein [Steroidobacteraceae bacterium]
MKVNRRAALKIAGGIALTTSLFGQAFAKSKPLKVLILGGTGFIGPHFVRVLTEVGHTVTLFNRGKRDPEAKPGVEQLLGDRNGQVDALKGRDWDVCIDNSGYKPSQVKLTADLLQPHIKHYIFISSVSAYADYISTSIDEDYKLASLKDPSNEEVTGETYGGLKVLCEQIVQKTYGKNANVIRPTYIAGPGDPTDRFTYWPVRVSRGGEMLAPGTAADPIGYIDVRDLADFVRVCVEKRIGGVYNLCNQPRSATIGELLEKSKRICGADTTFSWASAEFLDKHGMNEESAPPNAIPIWTPPSGDSAGFALIKCDRAVAKGLKFRALETTVRDTLEWQKTRPPERQTLRAGLPPEKENELLKALHDA